MFLPIIPPALVFDMIGFVIIYLSVTMASVFSMAIRVVHGKSYDQLSVTRTHCSGLFSVIASHVTGGFVVF